MPATWRDLLEELAPVFARRLTFRLFAALACGMILADRSTVVGMAAAAGMAERWRRACWFFSGAAWDIDALGLAVARLIVEYLLAGGEPVVVACDSTFFKRWGRRVFQARWAYDGAAQGGKKVAFGNTWVVAAIVVKLPFCSSPVALPVLLRLWRGKATASAVELAAEMLGKLTGAFPGRAVHRVGDAAFHGEPLVIDGATWTTSSWSAIPVRPSRTSWACSPWTPALTPPPSPNATPGGGRSSRRMPPGSRPSASGTPATASPAPSSELSRSDSSSSPC